MTRQEGDFYLKFIGSWFMMILSLPDAAGMALLRCIHKYWRENTETPLDGEAAEAWSYIKSDMDRANKARIGGNARWEKERNAAHDAVEDAAHNASHDAVEDTAHNATHDAANGAYSIENNSIERYSIEHHSIQQTEKREKRFTPPLIDEVRKYCLENALTVDPERFIDYYETRGWMLSNNVRMKSWKAAIRNWQRTEKERGQVNTRPQTAQTNYSQRQYEEQKPEELPEWLKETMTEAEEEAHRELHAKSVIDNPAN